MPFVPVGLGLLMVATIRFPAPAKQIVWQRHPFIYLVLIVFILVALIFRPGLVLPVLFLGYLFYGLLQAARRAMFPPKAKAENQESQEE